MEQLMAVDRCFGRMMVYDMCIFHTTVRLIVQFDACPWDWQCFYVCQGKMIGNLLIIFFYTFLLSLLLKFSVRLKINVYIFDRVDRFYYF